MTFLTEDVARLIKETVRLHEESGLAEKRTHLGNYQMNMSIQNAAKKACGNSLWFPVWLLLSETWNDALHWAENTEAYNGLTLETQEDIEKGKHQ